MKKHSLIPALTGVLFVLTAFLAVATYSTIQFSRKARRIQSEVTVMNFTKINLEALIRETAAYAQTNHAVEPILMSIGWRPLGQAAPGARTPTR